MADSKQIKNKIVTLRTSTKTKENKLSFVKIEGINVPPAKLRQAASNKKKEDGREEHENEPMGQLTAKASSLHRQELNVP